MIVSVPKITIVDNIKSYVVEIDMLSSGD